MRNTPELEALNDEIATKVMGWEKPPRDQVGWMIDGVWTGVRDYYCDWSPTTDIKAAWEVHTHCCGQIFSKRSAYLKELGELLQNRIADGTGEKVRVAFPDAMKFLSPELICRAALAAVNTKPKTLTEAIDELRAIPAEWKNLDDPLGELRKIRYGTDE